MTPSHDNVLTLPAALFTIIASQNPSIHALNGRVIFILASNFWCGLLFYDAADRSHDNDYAQWTLFPDGFATALLMTMDVYRQ